MSSTKDSSNRVHEGRNVKRFREMLGFKQEALAYELGEEWTQKRVSIMESKEKIDADILAEVARVLKVPEEAIRNFDEETAINNINNNYDSSHQVISYNYDCVINPIDKLFELVDEIRKLHAEKEVLYERLLQNNKQD